MLLRSLFTCLVATALALPVKLPGQSQIRIAGSDMFAAEMTRELTSFAQRNDLKLELGFKGSTAALLALRNNEADLAIAVIGPLSPKPDDRFITRPAAWQTAVIAICESGASLNQITFDQLAGIYNQSETTNIRRWADLGVPGVQAQRTIRPIAISQRSSLTSELALATASAGGDHALKSTVTVVDTAAAALARLVGDESGIAILPLASQATTPAIKVLLVSRSREDTAYAPTPENLQSGTYPFRLPVQFVFRKEDAARLRPVLRELLSEDAEKMWTAAGFVPLPVSVRNELVFELETL
ncbi:MAG: substrate-binding domain-containing protein [Opitutaceae bacterium]|jgi:phosphate transport system substrate-binding protein|nr:substrate-binding domain-containing protein [Opitutaceae bacterium]